MAISTVKINATVEALTLFTLQNWTTKLFSRLAKRHTKSSREDC